jgi:RNA polymerase sigma-70 factor (ECF subfamily)
MTAATLTAGRMAPPRGTFGSRVERAMRLSGPFARSAGSGPPDEGALLTALRGGDEAAFTSLVERYHAPMVNVARGYVRDRATAEEVVQDSWAAALRGLDGFEGRSALSTWLFRIVMNQAKTRAVRERRSVPMSALSDDPEGPAVDPDRFHPPGHPAAGGWSVPPHSWADEPEARLVSRETREMLLEAIDELPGLQRDVVWLRDVQGLSASEVCDLLEITDANQRVLLHRGRSKVRQALEAYFDDGEVAA